MSEEDPPPDDGCQNTEENCQSSNIRALGAPGTVGALLNDLVRQAGSGEVVQVAFVVLDDEGSLSVGWDESISVETLTFMKDFLVLEVSRALMEDQYGEDAEF